MTVGLVLGEAGHDLHVVVHGPTVRPVNQPADLSAVDGLLLEQGGGDRGQSVVGAR